MARESAVYCKVWTCSHRTCLIIFTYSYARSFLFIAHFVRLGRGSGGGGGLALVREISCLGMEGDFFLVIKASIVWE